MELSKLQQKIVTSPYPRIVVLSAAASGKTRLLTERVRHLLRRGVAPDQICAITFTNLAAQELKDRLADDYKDGLIISTIHGLANRFLSRYGYSTKELIASQRFDELFDMLQEHQHCVLHIPYVLLDEAQDSSEPEFNFIFNMIRPESFFIVGDMRQSIYSFRGAEPTLLYELSQRPDVVTYDLNENYRNKSNILNYAKKILKRCGMDDSSIPQFQGGQVYEFTYDLDNLAYWLTHIDKFCDWAILCSTNEDIAFILRELALRDIPAVTFKQGDLDKAKLNDFMKQNCVKVLTRHSAKGLEFNNVIVYNAAWWGGDEAARANYVAATRAKNVLIWVSKSKRRR